jgi:simple sugar transport system ATP-binding protein
MTDIALSLKQATKLYAGVPAIEDVDFDLRRGEIHALVGENGAGKSTLTKVMAGVVTLTSGTMTVDGRRSRRVISALPWCFRKTAWCRR